MLIKSVIQAFPAYLMSVCIPNGVILELEKLIRSFWWSQSLVDRKVHWVNWSVMTVAKKGGGFGFRELVLFNKALLGKFVCWLAHNPTSLMAKFLAIIAITFRYKYKRIIPSLVHIENGNES